MAYYDKYKPKGEMKCEYCAKPIIIYLNRDWERKRFCCRSCQAKWNTVLYGRIPPRPSKEAYKKSSETRKNMMASGLIPKPPTRISKTKEKILCACGNRMSSKKSKQCIECRKKKAIEKIRNIELSKLNIRPRRSCKITKRCPVCNKEFSRFPSLMVENSCCSRSCNGYYNCKKGDKSHLYRLGSTVLIKRIRRSEKFNSWRMEVIERDKNRCAECLRENVFIHVHHIKSLSKIIKEFIIKNNLSLKTHSEIEIAKNMCMSHEELWSVNNGISLCFYCHQKRHPNIKLSIKYATTPTK